MTPAKTSREQAEKWLVAFDLDDTLFPERDFVKSGFEAVAEFLEEKYLVKDFFDVAWDLFEKGCRGDIFDRALPACGIDVSKSAVKELVSVYREHEPTIEMFPDAKAILSLLKDKQNLAIVTDGYLTTQQNKVAALEIEPWVQKIIYTDEFGPDYWKPNPLAFEELMKHFNAPPERSIYIADNPAKDFLAPNRLGWKTVQIKRPKGEYADEEAPQDHKAQKVISTLDEIAVLYPLI